MAGRQSISSRSDTTKALALRKKAGAWLRSMREFAGLTQREIAEKTGMKNYTFVSQIEAGAARVPQDMYADWADAIGVSRAEFAMQMLRYYDPFIYRCLTGSAEGAEAD